MCCPHVGRKVTTLLSEDERIEVEALLTSWLRALICISYTDSSVSQLQIIYFSRIFLMSILLVAVYLFPPL